MCQRTVESESENLDNLPACVSFREENPTPIESESDFYLKKKLYQLTVESESENWDNFLASCLFGQ